jgi:hypothetical protein
MEREQLRKVVEDDEWDILYLYLNNKLLFTSYEPELRIVTSEDFVFGVENVSVNSIKIEFITDAKIKSKDLILNIKNE